MSYLALRERAEEAVAGLIKQQHFVALLVYGVLFACVTPL